MKNNWQMKKLGEICDISIGKTPPRGRDEFWDKEKETANVWLSIRDLKKSSKKEVFDSREYISEKGSKLFKKVKKGTLLVSFKLTLGRLAFAGKDLQTNEAIAALNIKDEQKELNKEFLYYFLSFFDWDGATNGEVKVKGKTLNKAKLKEIEILFPPLPEQKRVVKILDEVFEKIKKAKENAKKNLENSKELFESFLQETFIYNSKWESVAFEKSINKIIYTNKIQRKAFLEKGKFPVVSQEKSLINGYWNKKEDVFEINRPVIIFGDHTQILKYIDFSFVLGADGVKILQPKDILEPKFFYYFLRNINLKTLGYARHYRLLKEKLVLFPKSKAEQQQIIKKLDSLSEQTKKLEKIYQQKLDDLEELKKSVLKKAFEGKL